jgi:PA14 domain
MDILKLDPNEEDEYLEDAEIEAEIEEEELGIAAPAKPSIADRKSFKVGIAAAFVYTLVLIGNTIGASITLNNASPIEYGQGAIIAQPCDDNGMRVTAISVTDTSTVPYSFYLAGLKFDQISDSCINQTFKLTIYDSDMDVVDLGYNQIVSGVGADAKFAKFLLTRNSVDSDGIDWRVFPASTFPNPPSETGLTICGGEFDLSDTINYDFGSDVPKPGCPADNYLIHWRGFIKIPKADDGVKHDVVFSLFSNGKTQVQINNQNIITDRQGHDFARVNGSFPMKYGRSYAMDVWMFKSTGTAKIRLDWNVDSEKTIPAGVFQYDASISAQVSASEGTTDYYATYGQGSADSRSFTVYFPKQIPADSVSKFTLETS